MDEVYEAAKETRKFRRILRIGIIRYITALHNGFIDGFPFRSESVNLQGEEHPRLKRV